MQIIYLLCVARMAETAQRLLQDQIPNDDMKNSITAQKLLKLVDNNAGNVVLFAAIDDFVRIQGFMLN